IQITAAISYMDSYETVAIFAANAFPPPVGEGQGGGSRQQPGRFGILSGCRASYGLEGSLLKNFNGNPLLSLRDGTRLSLRRGG
ncbi:MAG: hypothetical protein ACFN9G_07425, partial [Cardiobacterium sp.]